MPIIPTSQHNTRTTIPSSIEEWLNVGDLIEVLFFTQKTKSNLIPTYKIVNKMVEISL